MGSEPAEPKNTEEQANTDAYGREPIRLRCRSCSFAGKALASEGCPECGTAFFPPLMEVA